MVKSSALKLAYSVLNDNRNWNKYAMTQIRNMETMEVTATYNDAVNVVAKLYKEAIEEEKKNG